MKLKELFYQWQKKNNPFFPNEMKWDRNTIYKMIDDFEKSLAQNFLQPDVSRSVPYQLCPKCGGDGDLLRYNSPALMGTNARPICDVCDGKKIISMAHFA